MLGIIFCIASFITTYVFARRSLGQGLVVVFSVGYFYGLLRARFPDVGSHFIFDVSLIALYIARFSAAVGIQSRLQSDPAKAWATALICWPVVVMAYGPMIVDTQPIMVQLVGFRALAFVIPCIVLGARLKREDLDRLAPAVAILNCVALGFAALEYFFGVETFVPHNDVSDTSSRRRTSRPAAISTTGSRPSSSTRTPTAAPWP